MLFHSCFLIKSKLSQMFYKYCIHVYLSRDWTINSTHLEGKLHCPVTFLRKFSLLTVEWGCQDLNYAATIR